MSVRWHSWAFTLLLRARNLGLTVLTFGAAQVLLALVLWPLLFRAYPQGFSMALSLVGFGNWLVSSFASFGRGRRPSSEGRQLDDLDSSRSADSVVDHVRSQIQRSGCGFLFFLSSIVPLGLAFALRVRADLQRGFTWRDLFPPVP
jgi:hypothetical protein